MFYRTRSNTQRIGKHLAQLAGHDGSVVPSEHVIALYAHWSSEDDQLTRFTKLKNVGSRAIHLLRLSAGYAIKCSLDDVNISLSEERYEQCLLSAYGHDRLARIYEVYDIPVTWSRFAPDMIEATAGVIYVNFGLTAVLCFMRSFHVVFPIGNTI